MAALLLAAAADTLDAFAALAFESLAALVLAALACFASALRLDSDDAFALAILSERALLLDVLLSDVFGPHAVSSRTDDSNSPRTNFFMIKSPSSPRDLMVYHPSSTASSSLLQIPLG
jgi:hypothetical protein